MLLLLICCNVHHQHKKIFANILRTALLPSVLLNKAQRSAPCDVNTYGVCVCVWQRLQAPVLWLPAASLGCTNCFWIRVMQVHELKPSPKQFLSNQDQLALPHANSMAQLMPSTGNCFLVWQYQWEDKNFCGTLKPTAQSGVSLSA